MNTNDWSVFGTYLELAVGDPLLLQRSPEWPLGTDSRSVTL